MSQPVPIEEVLLSPCQLHGSPLDLLSQSHVLLMLMSPELDAGFQVWSHERGRIPSLDLLAVLLWM